MKKIGILSDTHGWLDERIFEYFKDCDEVWHAGDFGNIALANDLKTGLMASRKSLAGHDLNDSTIILRGVYGNIDGQDVRSSFPEKLHFTCEGVNVFMTHIGGHPAKYAPGIKDEIREHHSTLFICGHSHILRIIHDDKLDCLHINPGAAGKQGWHQVRTIVRLVIDGANMKDCEVIELGKRI